MERPEWEGVEIESIWKVNVCFTLNIDLLNLNDLSNLWYVTIIVVHPYHFTKNLMKGWLMNLNSLACGLNSIFCHRKVFLTTHNVLLQCLLAKSKLKGLLLRRISSDMHVSPFFLNTPSYNFYISHLGFDSIHPSLLIRVLLLIYKLKHSQSGILID